VDICNPLLKTSQEGRETRERSSQLPHVEAGGMKKDLKRFSLQRAGFGFPEASEGHVSDGSFEVAR
jgi:hypothetical protein